MWTVIKCAGHPRDMGLAQGAANRGAVREACGALGLSTQRSRMPSLAALNTGGLRGRGAGREIFRHFAHQAERLEGLARSAGVPMDSVLSLHLESRSSGQPGGLLARRAGLRAYTEGSDVPAKRVLLERSLPPAMPGESPWIIRESRPAVGFGSIEVGLPWLVSSVAGINEAGLAVMASPTFSTAAAFSGGPPPQLLVQECLQRFQDLGGALDWCQKRPVEGEQTFVLADASGALATVLSNGLERRVQEGEGELFLEGGEPASADTNADTNGGANGEEATPAPDGKLTLDPSARSLRVEAAHAKIELSLETQDRPSDSEGA